MKRDVDMRDISDGKLYESRDMVKVGCGDCVGCHKCCSGVGDSIVLDPLDICRLMLASGKSFEQLMEKHIELGVVDGIILPHMKMNPETNACTFLNSEGRCSIHKLRPGICRLFPLGRIYDDEGFKYFIQIHECPKENKTKVKISSWMDTDNLKRYERYIIDWHELISTASEMVMKKQDEEYSKRLSLNILKTYYYIPCESEELFYTEFYARYSKMGSEL